MANLNNEQAQELVNKLASIETSEMRYYLKEMLLSYLVHEDEKLQREKAYNTYLAIDSALSKILNN
jgi:hypothetical protein